MVVDNPSRLLVLCWSHNEGDLAFMKLSRALTDMTPVILSSSLQAVLRAALDRPAAVVVLRPETKDEHLLIEEFLLQIGRESKFNTHYVIVVSERARRFESGVQSHSVLNTFDEDAIVRAARQGVEALTVRDEDRERVVSGAAPSESGPLPQPSLLEYFKLPAYKRPLSIVAELSSGDREHIAVALGELAHAAPDVEAGADTIERAAAWIRKHWKCEVALISKVELVRFHPTRSQPVTSEVVPPPGEGSLLGFPALSSLLGVSGSESLQYCWVEELECCLLAWGPSSEKSRLAQALMYTILRMRRSEIFHVRKAG